MAEGPCPLCGEHQDALQMCQLCCAWGCTHGATPCLRLYEAGLNARMFFCRDCIERWQRAVLESEQSHGR